MKVIKEGKIKKNKRGGYTISGYHFDLEGENLDLERFIKISLQRMDKE